LALQEAEVRMTRVITLDALPSLTHHPILVVIRDLSSITTVEEYICSCIT